MPVREIEQLRKASLRWEEVSVTPEAPFWQNVKEDLLEMEVDLDIRSGEEVLIRLKSSEKDEVIVGYDPGNQWLFIDRTHSGVSDFHPSFASKHGAKMAAIDGKIQLHLWLDRNAVEVYGNQGLVVLTDQIFPKAPLDQVEVITRSGEVVVDSVQIHTLKSVEIPYVYPKQVVCQEG
ncbi:Levanase precursor [compost metagenome]